MSELKLLLERATHDLGFHFFALLHHADVRVASDRFVRLDNYPHAWVEEWLGRGFDEVDPVHEASREVHRAFAWTELSRLIPLSSEQRLVLRRSRSFGIGRGFTLPLTEPGEVTASCSFAMHGKSPLPTHRLSCAQDIATHAFVAARRIERASRVALRPRLSPRETECVGWLARGKSDWEIALILGISVETVRQYVKRARAAYEAVSRAQLAVLAFEDDWISRDPITPRRRPRKFPRG
jgi:LuxR family quorum-sensing system transcriptional regulator CciR